MGPCRGNGKENGSYNLGFRILGRKGIPIMRSIEILGVYLGALFKWTSH